MRTSGEQSSVSFVRLLRREWPIFAIAILCLFLATPSYVAAQINQPIPIQPSAPSNVSADFMIFGDSQGSFGYVWPVAPVFDEMIEVMNQIDAPIAFHTGDFYVGDSMLAMDVDSQAKRFLNDISALEKAWFPVMGNHDAAGDGWEVTREMIFYGGDTYYSFDIGDSHFIVLDAFMPDHKKTISKEQMGWLEYDLQNTTKKHIFVFSHAPLYSLGPHAGGCLDSDPVVRDHLVDIFVEYGVDVVFNGHEHSYANFQYKGITQVTGGGAGGDLRSFADFEDLAGGKFGYDLEEIDRWKVVKTLHYVCVNTSDENIEVTAYDLHGNMIDWFSVPT